MPGGLENTEEAAASSPVNRARQPLDPPRARPGEPESDEEPNLDLTYSDANITIDAHEDRWHWRRKIRSKPAQLRVYRVAVAIAGLSVIVLGLVTGPLPGPGGIPLVLLGLAIWASEFEWAHRLMHRFKALLKRFQSWTRPQQTLFWVVFFSICGLCGYLYLLVLGIPTWLPTSVDSLLQRLPGL